jgi:hypothetical protein
MLHSSTISCQLMQLLFYSHIHFSKYITYKQATSKNTSSKDHAYRIRPLAIIVVAFVGCILQNGIFHKEKDAIYQLISKSLPSRSVTLKVSATSSSHKSCPLARYMIASTWFMTAVPGSGTVRSADTSTTMICESKTVENKKCHFDFRFRI